ncbi:DUF3618 domain-containing protein [Xylanimonas oleitrophica]|uniref:DUF3618 domain-containing protein n=1 Tax=Xylanimonas oleitrophica TaxID=2607479 RepID=A0A2W5WPP9_9MICO|nr:DUF3618 domain-containing protein [Xylanimonas oleitrophica]PZR53549.1 DUF3618 domain-containing protein [Xylanimonas oleitrophica]
MSTTPEQQLPRPAGHAAPGTGAAPTGKEPTAKELRSEVERARAELGATIDELTTRLSPGYQAAQLASATRTAASDAGGLLTGDGLPADERRARNVKVLLGAAGAVVLVVTALVVRKVRS